MKVFILAFVIIVIAIIGLSIGLLLGRRRLKRSCEARTQLMNSYNCKNGEPDKCESCSCGHDD